MIMKIHVFPLLRTQKNKNTALLDGLMKKLVGWPDEGVDATRGSGRCRRWWLRNGRLELVVAAKAG